MKIIEILNITACSDRFFACRNEEEAKIIAMYIQDNGGIPMRTEKEVPDWFDEFALDFAPHSITIPT
jgi:hypothetical protein